MRHAVDCDGFCTPAVAVVTPIPASPPENMAALRKTDGNCYVLAITPTHPQPSHLHLISYVSLRLKATEVIRVPLSGSSPAFSDAALSEQHSQPAQTLLVIASCSGGRCGPSFDHWVSKTFVGRSEADHWVSMDARLPVLSSG
jgi:hypothetical protein